MNSNDHWDDRSSAHEMDWSDVAPPRVQHDDDDVDDAIRLMPIVVETVETTTVPMFDMALEPTRVEIRPSRFLPLLLHRDDILTKNFHMQYFFGGLLIVILLVLGYLIRALPSNLDDVIEVDPWSGHSNSMTPIWYERLTNASSQSSIRLTAPAWSALQRISFGRTSNGTTLMRRINLLGSSLWQWFIDPHRADPLWSRVLILQRRSLSGVVSDVELIDFLMDLSIYNLIWNEWFTPLLGCTSDTESPMIDALHGLQTQWQGSHGRNWVHHAWRHVTMHPLMTVPVFHTGSLPMNRSMDDDDDNDDDELVQHVDRRLALHNARIQTDTVSFFIASFQHMLLSTPSVWLDDQRLVDAWDKVVDAQGIISMDALLTRHVPYIDVMLRGKFPQHTIPRLTIWVA